jgi:hypothetical protein
MSLYVPTKSSDNTRPIVQLEEATYGVPVPNGVYKHVGVATEFNWSKNRDVEDLYMVSLEYPYGEYAFGTEYEFVLTYAMTDTKVFRQGAMLPAGTGTIAKGLTFVQSKMINDVEMFRVFQGNITESLSCTYERILRVEQTFRPKTITHWLTELEKDTALGATVNLDPAPLTAEPFTVRSSVTLDPLTIGGAVVDVGEFDLNVEWQILIWQPQNHIEPKFIGAQRRETTGSLRTTVKDNVLEDLVVSRVAAPMVMQISNTPGPDVDWTFGGVRFNNYATEDVGDSDEFDTYTVDWKATTFTVQDV